MNTMILRGVLAGVLAIVISACSSNGGTTFASNEGLKGIAEPQHELVILKADMQPRP